MGGKCVGMIKMVKILALHISLFIYFFGYSRSIINECEVLPIGLLDNLKSQCEMYGVFYSNAWNYLVLAISSIFVMHNLLIL